MIGLPHTPDLLALARKVVWFEPPEKALSNLPRFIAYALTFGLHDDIKVLRRHLADDDLRAALDAAPPGIFDNRSWAYWQLKLGRYPTPPLPERHIP
jgi:hypothetical protein